jgi:hypothetical protein
VDGVIFALGKIRVVGMQDIFHGELWRCDILFGDQQIQIDGAWKGGPQADDIEVIREMFGNHLKDKGLSWNDVKRLPLPSHINRAFYV